MVPAQSNKDVAGYTTEELLYPVPEIFGLKNFFRRISICLLEERVRIAMMFVPFAFPKSSGILTVVTANPHNRGIYM